jgi:flagellar hook assembly protein FlgD
MKNTIAALTLALLIGSQAFAANPTLSGVSLVAAKKSIMYFKFDRELKGAEVQVYDHNGNIIAHHTLHKHKLIIDFIDAEPGNYTVVVIKDNKFKAFHYTQIDNDAIPDRMSASSTTTHSDIIFY